MDLDFAAYDEGSLKACQHSILPATDAAVGVGSGLFETLLVHHGVPFARRHHVARLMASCDALALPRPDREELEHAIDALANHTARRDLAAARLRITWYALPHAKAGILRAHTGPFPQRPEYAALASVPYRVDPCGPLTGLKSVSYAPYTLATAYAHQRGADEALLLNTHGRVCEGAASNIFAIFDSELVTPPLTEGPLPGITRDLVITWARLEGYVVSELPLSCADIRSADGLLLTSSLRGVHPVASVDQSPVQIPPVAKALRSLFTKRRAATPLP